MSATAITLLDLARDPAEVARGLPQWQRGDHDEAIAATLATSARQLHGREYTLWIWTGQSVDGHPAWLLPVPSRTSERFSPRGPARVLLRCLDAAVLLGGGNPEIVRLERWRGHTCLIVPGMDAEFAAFALGEQHPPPSRAALAELPENLPVGGEPISLERIPTGGGDGIEALARELSVHPARVALTLIAHGQPAAAPEHPPELVRSLREWGCVGQKVPESTDEPSLAIADDPCPRRRNARRVLQRLLRVGKVGAGYHTEFDHLYRGVPPDARQQALEVGEALLKAGLLGEKPSVGQRHVYLRREALSEIHALIDRGESTAPSLRALWTAPGPTERAPSP